MSKLLSIILSFVFILHTSNIYAENLLLSSNTTNNIKKVFGFSEIQKSDKILIKIMNLQKAKSGNTFVEGHEVTIRLAYRGHSNEIELIGIFLEGNKEPLIAKIIPGESATKRVQYIVKGNIENYCFKTNKILVVVKKKNKLLASSKSFYSFISDCGTH